MINHPDYNIGKDYHKEIIQSKKAVRKLKRIPLLSVVAQFDMPESTKKMKRNQKQTISEMLQHNQFCTEVISKNGGIVIKELGDAVLVMFPSVPSACYCGLEIIRNLKKYGKGICTKVTITAGDIERIKTRCEPDIYGTPVNFCNRMSRWAHRNSVLIEENRFPEVHLWLSDPKIHFCRSITRNLKEFGKQKLRKINLK